MYKLHVLSIDEHQQYFIGAYVAEWLRSLTSDHLPLAAVGSNPDRDFGGSYPASLRNVGGSTQMPLCAWKMRSSSTSKAETSPNDLYCVGVKIIYIFFIVLFLCLFQQHESDSIHFKIRF
jgi:hypothetical protein